MDDQRIYIMSKRRVNIIRKGLFLFLIVFSQTGFGQTERKKGVGDVFVCTPCGYDCDKEEFSAAGTCKHCNMKLVKKNTIVFGTVKPEDICLFIKKHPKTILLDVRTREEFAGTAPENFGRLKNAINIPIQELEKRIGELKNYKNTAILVYCSHSHRSPQSSYILNQQGFSNVFNLSGGMSVWQNEVAKNNCSQKYYTRDQLK